MSVNGTTFRKWNGQWWPERGHHALLDEVNGELVFTSPTGMKFYYAMPTAPTLAWTADAARDRISLIDGMPSRIGLLPSVLDLPGAGSGSPSTPPSALPNRVMGAGIPTPLSKVMDRNGNTLTLAYAADGLLESVTDAVGRTATLTYARGAGRVRLERVSAPGGVTISYAYDERGYLTSVSRAGRTERYEYAAEQGVEGGDYNLVRTIVSPDGTEQLTTHIDYGTEASVGPNLATFLRHVRATDVVVAVRYPWRADELASEPRTSFAYPTSTSSNTRVVTNANGRDTTYVLNVNGNPSRIEEPLGRTTELTWSADVGERDNVVVRQVETIENGRTRTTRTEREYDARGRLTSVTAFDPLGHTTTTTLDPRWSAPLTSVDRNGVETAYTYDAHGNPLTLEDGDGHTSTFTYDPRGLVLTSQEAGHTRPTKFTYDAYGYRDTVEGPEGSETDTDYDVLGRLVRTVDPRGNETTFGYDDLGRLTSVTFPAVTLQPGRVEARDAVSDNRTITRTYDLLGNVLTATSLHGLTLTRTYTARGQLKSLGRSFGGGTRQFTYDAMGALLTQTDWVGTPTSHGYDELGRQTTTTNRMGRTATVGYDLAGRATSVTDYEGTVTNTTYDDLDRAVSSETLGLNGSRVEMTYYDESNPGTNLKTYTIERAPFADATTTFTYDRRYNLVDRENESGTHSTWTFDASGDLVEHVDDAGRTTRRDYDEQHRLEYTHLDSTSGTVTTRTRYDVAGNVIERVDPLGRSMFYEYDERNRMVVAVDQEGKRTRLLRDELGQVVNVRDRLDYDRSTFRDPLGRVTSAVDGNGSRATFTYDANGNVEFARIPSLGRVTRLYYDAADRVTQIIEGVGRPEERSRQILERDGMGNVLRTTDYNGNESAVAYDAEYRPIRYTDAQGHEAHIEYGRSGLVTAVVDRRGYRTEFGYDALGRQTLVRNALEEEVTRTFDDAGHMRTETDARSIVTEADYDDLDRLTEVRRAGQRVARYTYDALGNVRTVHDALDHETIYTYDTRNRRTGTQYADGTTTSVVYDDEGRVVRAENEENEAVRFEYDGAGRVLRSVLLGAEDEALEITSMEYDAVGNLVRRTDPEGQAGGRHAGFSRTFEYDAFDRLTRVVEGSLTTRYEYDDNGNLRHAYLPPNVHTEYTYDTLNRPASLVQHRTGGTRTWSFPDYDEEGNLRRAVDAMGQERTFTYDALGRPEHATLPARTGTQPSRGWLSEVEYGYDPNGNVDEVTQTRVGPGGTGGSTEQIVRTYDDFDRLDTETNRGLTIDYDYDANGNRTQVSSLAGQAQYRYDERNRLDRVTIDNLATEYTYYPDGLAHTVTRPNGAVTTYTPEPYTNRLAEVVHATVGAPIARAAYTYDKNGNPRTESQTIGGVTENTTFDYDALDRMVSYARSTEGQIGSATGTYTFEGYDRKTETLVDPAGTTTDRTYHYDESRRLERVTVTQGMQPARTVTYGYDENGNTTSRTDSGNPAQPWQFTYDGSDHLTDVVRGAPGAETLLGAFEYDAGGRRIRHHGSDRGDIETHYDGSSPLEEREVGTGNLVAHYRYGQSLLALDTPAQGRQWYHQDARDSTMALTNQVGANVDATYRLDPFGSMRSQTGSSANRRVFTGHEHDTQTGLVYMGARFYDPETGRFLTQDSYLGQNGTPPSLNRYLYAFSNPAKYVDPDGHWPLARSEMRRADGMPADPPPPTMPGTIQLLYVEPGSYMNHDFYEMDLSTPLTPEEFERARAADVAASMAEARSAALPPPPPRPTPTPAPTPVADRGGWGFGMIRSAQGFFSEMSADVQTEFRTLDRDQDAIYNSSSGPGMWADMFAIKVFATLNAFEGGLAETGQLAAGTIGAVVDSGTINYGAFVDQDYQSSDAFQGAMARTQNRVETVERVALAVHGGATNYYDSHSAQGMSNAQIGVSLFVDVGEAGLAAGGSFVDNLATGRNETWGNVLAGVTSMVSGVGYASVTRRVVAEAGEEILETGAGAMVRQGDDLLGAARTHVDEVAESATRHADEVADVTCPGGICPCFVAGTMVSTVAGSVAIDSVRVGDRVLTSDASCSEDTLEGYVEIFVAMRSADGDVFEVVLLRSTEWLQELGVAPGRVFTLELTELGMRGPARILTVAPYRRAKEGAGCPVTATVRHRSGAVIDLHLEGTTLPLQVTAQHPLFSETRDGWVGAGELEPGERLRTASGAVCCRARDTA